MKKLVSAILVMVFLFSTVLAENFDFSSMTDEQLLQIQEELLAEMKRRYMVDDLLYTGTYVVGEDLVPGRYVIESTEVRTTQFNSTYVEWQIYEKNEETGKLERIHADDAHKIGETFSFTLKEGQQLRIANGTFKIIQVRAK